MATRLTNMFTINNVLTANSGNNSSVLFNDVTYNAAGVAVNVTANASYIPPVSEKVLRTLRYDYLEKLVHTCSSGSNIGSYQQLYIIMKSLTTSITSSNYDVMLVEVIKLLTSLIQRSQSQYVEILLLKKEVTNFKNLVTIKEQEIEVLKDKLQECIDDGNINDLYNAASFGGNVSMTGTTLPDQIIFLMHIDIVRAWYYYLYGVPDDCSILDPNKVISVFSYLSNNFKSLEEAKTGLRNLVENN